MSKKQCSEINITNIQSSSRIQLFSSYPSLEQIRLSHNEFCIKFDVDEINSKENTFIALIAEIGQLAKILKWKKSTKNNKQMDSKTRTKLEDVLADALVYIVRIANEFSVDLPKSVLRKTDKNIMKFYNVKIE